MSNSLKYKDVYEQSINRPDVFWGKAAQEIQCRGAGDACVEKIFRKNNPPEYEEFYKRISNPALPVLERFQRLLWVKTEVMEEFSGE